MVLFHSFVKITQVFYQKTVQQIKTCTHNFAQSVIFVDKTWKIVENLLLYRGLLLSILRRLTIYKLHLWCKGEVTYNQLKSR